ncbi:MAG: BlaI/MecI/CopY family transcriptional regulator [Lachnospiraceae bacterium]|nr:BlaI/MecI/CopY family transcriptional regulator [Lachnospiraceae bacterium]
MKKQGVLNKREEELMNILWAYNEPLTQNEMAERLEEQGWSSVTLFKTVQSLSGAGYLQVVGLEKSAKTYARKLIPAISKEEYYTSILMKNGLDSGSLANITAAFIGVSKKSEKEKNTEVIAKLEEIIEKLRMEGQE